jgi:hypothetical protein
MTYKTIERLQMHNEQRIDQIIKKASAFIDKDTNPDLCRQLAGQAVDCLTTVVGPDHPYTKMVEEAADNGARRSLSTACGVLWATKLQLDNERHGTGRQNESASHWRELSGYLS